MVQNQKGQGLIEYLILVAIVAIGSLVVVRVLGSNIRTQFAHINNALTGTRTQVPYQDMPEQVRSKLDMQNFLEGAAEAK